MVDPTLTRRQMLLASALAAASFVPVVNTLAASAATIDAGEITNYAKAGIYSDFRSQGFFIVRRGNRIVAQSALCTHKRSRLSASADGFVCKSHNSAFAIDGSVTRGPAKEPLRRLGISLTDGRLMVDTKKTFGPDQFGSAGAFVDASA